MADLFEDKAEEWDQMPVPLQISSGVFRAMAAARTFAPSEVILDFGAGTGLVCTQIAPQVKSVLAVDISPSMLEQLEKKREEHPNLQPICQDILESPLMESVNGIVSAMAMHHVEDTAALARALFSHLKPGGWLLLADLDQEDGTFHPSGTEGVFHHGFERPSVERIFLDAGFESVAFETAVTVQKDGRDFPVFLMTTRRPRV